MTTTKRQFVVRIGNPSAPSIIEHVEATDVLGALEGAVARAGFSDAEDAMYRLGIFSYQRIGQHHQYLDREGHVVLTVEGAVIPEDAPKP